MWIQRLRLWGRKRRDQHDAIVPTRFRALWGRKRRDQHDAIVPTRFRAQRFRSGKRMAQEDVFVAASSSHGETEDVRKEFALSSVSPNFLNPMQSFSPCAVHSGAETARTSAAAGPSSSPFFFSERIQSLRELRSDLGSEVECEIEASKSTWTETSSATSSEMTSEMTSDFDDEEQRVADSVAFEKLKEHPEWGPFLRRQPYELEIVKKIAEGGQGEIFEALGTNKHDTNSDRYLSVKPRLVVKVFKKGFSLEVLQRRWPPGLASAALPYRYFNRSYKDGVPIVGHGLCWSVGAQLLANGRFAFIFDRFWGDFRKLIDMRMLKSNGAPPFSLSESHSILKNIAQGMVMLHNCGLLHRDLKAANVLTVVRGDKLDPDCVAYIADFESSVGIAGTGYWRAPEVLRALKNGDLKNGSWKDVEPFTQKSDVYSYAMTCYEVLTGRVPFEGHTTINRDKVLSGERPPLPDDIDPFYKDLMMKCWHEDPLQRPSFHEIVAHLQTLEVV